MDWLKLIQLIPLTIIGIQQIHADTIAGATKKQLAMESLGLAGVVASNTLTGNNAALASGTAQLASSLIDQFTTLFKSTSQFGFTPNVPVVNPSPGVALGTAVGATNAGK